MRNPVRKSTLIILLILIAGLLAGKTAVQKMLNYMDDLDSQIEQCKFDLQNATTEILNNQEYIKKWNSISDFKNELIEDRQTNFMGYLQGLEAQRDFDFTDLSVPSVGRLMDENNDFQVLSYKLTFPVDLEDLVEFLAQIDSSDTLLHIDRIEITKRKAPLPGRPQDLMVKMTVSTPATAQPAGDTSTDGE
ncbi:MAG: hypothetical protein JW860_07470 [Sedimentisphaerales bacterium]|nr:hypothetical protein [Sedimentisphaerales bacterium]